MGENLRQPGAMVKTVSPSAKRRNDAMQRATYDLIGMQPEPGSIEAVMRTRDNQEQRRVMPEARTFNINLTQVRTKPQDVVDTMLACTRKMRDAENARWKLTENSHREATYSRRNIPLSQRKEILEPPDSLQNESYTKAERLGKQRTASIANKRDKKYRENGRYGNSNGNDVKISFVTAADLCEVVNDQLSRQFRLVGTSRKSSFQLLPAISGPTSYNNADPIAAVETDTAENSLAVNSENSVSDSKVRYFASVEAPKPNKETFEYLAKALKLASVRSERKTKVKQFKRKRKPRTRIKRPDLPSIPEHESTFLENDVSSDKHLLMPGRRKSELIGAHVLPAIGDGKGTSQTKIPSSDSNGKCGQPAPDATSDVANSDEKVKKAALPHIRNLSFDESSR